ncbi:MTH938/NDUFAF3 family protein [candidate division KSB1 bacterium]
MIITSLDDPRGPIEKFIWGKFIINGQEHSKISTIEKGVGKDIRLIGNDVSAWKERKGHRLNIEKITGIFDKGIEALIIGLGVNGLMECPAEVSRFIKEKGISELLLKPTAEACKKYNELYHKGIKVAMLAHATC